ncbi:MAG TPA: DAHL domain-containing protein [Solimonas sp.]|nr:DAHL domain-containing protein [Solimonas sp.]
MKVLKQLLFVLLAVAAIGGLGYLVMMTQSVDADLHRNRLEHLRVVANLDVALNRQFTESRVSSMADSSTNRSDTTGGLDESLNAIDKDAGSLRGLSPEIDKALDTFLDTIESKFELAFDSEAKNTLLTQRLINSMDAVPTYGDNVSNVASEDQKETVRNLAMRVKTEVLNFGVTPTPSPSSVGNIRAILDEMAQLAPTQSEEFKTALQGLRDRCEEVIADKTELTDKYRAFLDRPTGPQLQVLEKAYLFWHEGQVAVANQYRVYLAAYAGGLLLVLALLGVRLARSFREVDRANAKLSDANEHLEEQVTTRTKDLSSALQELRASQAQLVQSEKMASLGTMVAGVAHEINTPLGYARSNTEIVRGSLTDLRGLVGAQDRALRLMTSEGASDEDVAAALGDAEARRAEINPEEMLEDLSNLMGDTDHGLGQISELVLSLKDFSRVDRSRNDLFDVNAGIESALKIAHTQLKHRVEVVRQFGKVPQVECSPSQLNQVFLNLFTNAAQAIDGEGKIYVHTAAEGSGVSIRILDTGCGMSEDVRARIFEPFFTTKAVGKGTGLGLSIVYRIIEEHGGRIEVRSAPGKGSEFIIQLPCKQKRQTESAPALTPAPELAAA